MKPCLFFLGLLIMLALGLPMIFICEHLGNLTYQFQILYLTSFLITLAITCLFGAIFILLYSGSVIWFSKHSIPFTDLEEGELRSAIEKMIEGAKKVSRIMVYNESKKSTSKNALLKLLWHKEFGIAG